MNDQDVAAFMEELKVLCEKYRVAVSGCGCSGCGCCGSPYLPPWELDFGRTGRVMKTTPEYIYVTAWTE